jgi:lysyl-tRNA synthetase class II
MQNALRLVRNKLKEREKLYEYRRLRAKIISQIRRYLDDHCGFVEVQVQFS